MHYETVWKDLFWQHTLEMLWETFGTVPQKRFKFQLDRGIHATLCYTAILLPSDPFSRIGGL